jgi:hypothetical protein
MSEQINKVLASTAQAFTTAEQKQARDNIGAQASGNYVEYSAISGDNNVISSINGSALSANAGFSGVWHTPAFTGSGTNSADKLGLNSAFTLKPQDNSAVQTDYAYNGMTANYYDHNTSYYKTTGVEIRSDLGGSTAHCWHSINGIAIETPLPGNDWVSSYFLKDGIKMCGLFASNVYQDDINSSMRYQGTGNTGNGMVQDIGFYNGSTVLRYPYITMYTPNESATIYMSSISSWDNKLSSVNVGFGLSGNGKDVALGVTACSGEFIGLHSDYFYALTSRDLVFSSVDKDNDRLEAKTVFNEYGMRMSANTAGRLVTLQDDGFRMASDASSLTASLDHAKLRMSDSGGYADLTKSSIDAIQAVYNWATSQGMQPI